MKITKNTTWKEVVEDTKKLSVKEKKILGLFLMEVSNTIYEKLFKDVLAEDYQDKKDLIKDIDMFKAIYKKTGSNEAKEAAGLAIERLEEVNARIARLKKVINAI
jgi:hypothetical protein